MALLLASVAGCATLESSQGVSTQASADLNSWSSDVDKQLAEMNASGTVSSYASPGQVLDDRPVIGIGELYRTGLSSNHRIAAASAQVQAADAELANAALRFFPSVTGRASMTGTYQDIIDSDNQVFQQGEAYYETSNVALEMRMPIVNIESVFNARKTAAARRKSYVEYIDTAQTYVRDLVLAYVDVAEADAVLVEYRDRVRLLSNHVAGERQRSAAGSGSPEAVKRYEQELANARSQLTLQETRREVALSRIRELTGETVGGVKGHVDLAALALPSPDASTLTNLALRNNARYAAKRYELEVFDDEVRRAAASDFGPTLDAFGSYEYEDRGGSQFGGGAITVQGVLGVELSVPIFNARGNGYQVTTARARNQQISAELAMVRRETESSIALALGNYMLAQQRITHDRAAVGAGSGLISLVGQRIDAGGAIQGEDLEAKLDQASYRRQLAQAEFQLLREWITIKYLVGAISEADIAIFDARS